VTQFLVHINCYKLFCLQFNVRRLLAISDNARFTLHFVIAQNSSVISFRMQAISKEAIDVMSKLLTDATLQSSACLFFDRLATTRPDAVQPIDDKFLAFLKADQDFSAMAGGILAKLATDPVRLYSRFRACANCTHTAGNSSFSRSETF
jgi:hypothetical protein